MAVLTDGQRVKAMRLISQGITTRWSRTQGYAALQAIEDWFEVNKANGSAAIDVATSPLVLTNSEKKRFFAYWLLIKHEIERT